MSVAKRMIFDEIYGTSNQPFTGEWQPSDTIPTSKYVNGYWSEVMVWNTDHDRCELVRVNNFGEAFWGDWDIKVPFSHWMQLPGSPI